MIYIITIILFLIFHSLIIDGIDGSTESTKILVGLTGKFTGSRTTAVEIFDLKTGTSTNIKNFPVTYTRPLGFVDGKTPLICGYGKPGVSNNCYKLVNNEWILGPEPIYSINSGSVTSVPNVGFWVVGGNLAKKTQIYSSDKWIDGVPMPTNYSNQAFGQCLGQINDSVSILVGGYEYNKTWAYNWDSKTWTTLKDMPDFRYQPACGFDKKTGKFVVTGGADPFVIYSSTLLYDPKLDSWTYGPNLPFKTTQAEIVTNDEYTVLVGGTDKIYLGKGTKHVLEYKDNEWKLHKGQLNYGRREHVAMFVN